MRWAGVFKWKKNTIVCLMVLVSILGTNAYTIKHFKALHRSYCNNSTNNFVINFVNSFLLLVLCIRKLVWLHTNNHVFSNIFNYRKKLQTYFIAFRQEPRNLLLFVLFLISSQTKDYKIQWLVRTYGQFVSWNAVSYIWTLSQATVKIYLFQ